MLINSQSFLDKLSFVTQGCQSKGAYPECHKYVLLEVEDGLIQQHIILRSFDGQTHYRAVLGQVEKKTIRGNIKPVGEGEEAVGGPFVFDPSRILTGLKKIKDQIKITIDLDKKAFLLTTKGTRIRESGMSAFAFTEFVDTDTAVRMPVPERFAQAIDNSIWAINPKHHQSELQGLMVRPIDVEGDKVVEICGTDKTMFSYAQDVDNGICFEEPGILPLAAAKSMSAMLKKFDTPSFSLADGRAYCQGGDFSIASILLSEKMIAFWSLIDMLKASDFLACTVDLDRLQDAIGLAKTYEDEYGSVLVKFDGEMKVLGFNPQTSRKAEASLSYKAAEGDSFDGVRFCVNASYLEKLVKATNSTTAKMMLAQGDQLKLIYFQPADSNSLEIDMFLSLVAMQPHYEEL